VLFKKCVRVADVSKNINAVAFCCDEVTESLFKLISSKTQISVKIMAALKLVKINVFCRLKTESNSFGSRAVKCEMCYKKSFFPRGTNPQKNNHLRLDC